MKERKQLKGQEDIEKALFDYNIYPAALMRKDATLKAASGGGIRLLPTTRVDRKRLMRLDRLLSRANITMSPLRNLEDLCRAGVCLLRGMDCVYCMRSISENRPIRGVPRLVD